MTERVCANCGAPIVAANGETFMRLVTVAEDDSSEAYYCVACTVQADEQATT